jgi:hypothetical protein
MGKAPGASTALADAVLEAIKALRDDLAWDG